MKITYAVLLILIAITPLKAQEQPLSIESSANIVISWLNNSNKNSLIYSNEKDLIKHHRTLGSAIRNEFKLFGNGNINLLKDCGGLQVTPDNCSMQIIKAVRSKLRQTYTKKELFHIDALNDSLDEIKIPTYKKKNSNLNEFLKFVNDEIAKTKLKDDLSIIATCKVSNYEAIAFDEIGTKSLQNLLSFFEYSARMVVIKGSSLIKLKSRKCEN